MSHSVPRLALLALLTAATPRVFAQSPWVAAPTVPWTVGQSFASTYFYSIQLTAPTNVWMVVGRYYSMGYRNTEVYASADEGQTWNRGLLSEYNNTWGTTFTDCWTLDGQIAWAVIQRYYTPGPPVDLLKTTTGVTGFATVTNPAGANLRFVRSFSANVAVAGVSSNGGTTWPFLRTTDGGLTWTPVAQPPAATAGDELGYSNSSSMLSNQIIVLGNHLWVATKNGNVLHTADQGQTWQTSDTGLGPILPGAALAFRDAQHGLAYGNNRLRRTTDGGQTWTTVPYTGPAQFTYMAAVPGTAASYLSVGNTGTALSTDDGATWVNKESSLVHNALAVSSPSRAWTDLQTAVASSWAGSVGHYAGNVLPTRQAAQAAVSLYPNPTSDVLHLPAADLYRKAIIYDVLGRQCLSVELSSAASTVSLASLGSGTYQVVLTGPTARQTSRITVLL